ncbi:hypothetical protein AMTR_s00016p00253840 [Amborella trichopoda]|uniref:Uncharacterized protein n=1 Tax=Amborella trichopoda TaxID=13333 RepID=W1PH22_AMBTC|nr:hypothetical protein AMTR_s00016p00253840 [Amborella trichopoda]
MARFDPWPVFFRREWNRNWPFLIGFAITGTIITKFTLGFTEEDAKNSPFVQRHKSEVSRDPSGFILWGWQPAGQPSLTLKSWAWATKCDQRAKPPLPECRAWERDMKG